MDLKNTNYTKKCEFCGKELKPVGLDYLYANIMPDSIKYERCTCSEARKYWADYDFKEQQNQKKKIYRDVINKHYAQSYMHSGYNKMNFENFIVTKSNQNEVNIAKDYCHKCIENKQDKGLIITGKAGVGKTHLAAAIANKLVEADKITIIGRLSTILDTIKETFNDNSKSDHQIIDLYSNVDMIIIDDLGTETINSWALEKLYTIVQNRIENGMPLIITTKFNKSGLIEIFSKGKDKEIAESLISKLDETCYGITLKAKEKVSTSDQLNANIN